VCAPASLVCAACAGRSICARGGGSSGGRRSSASSLLALWFTLWLALWLASLRRRYARQAADAIGSFMPKMPSASPWMASLGLVPTPRLRLEAFYAKHNPSKAGEVDSVILKCVRASPAHFLRSPTYCFVKYY